MPARALAFTAAVALLCLFLAALAVPAIPAVANPDSPRVSPLAATGLLVRPDESAEEILLRAHKQEATAMALAATGYAKGIGGFPQDSFLAMHWAKRLGYLGDLDAFALMSLPFWSEYPSFYADLGRRLASCALARKSPLAEPFKQAGFIDIDLICDGLEKEKAKAPNWEASSRQWLNAAKYGKELLAGIVTAARELRDRPATPEERERIGNIVNVAPIDSVFFYAATTHDLMKDRPDWSAQRLLSFFAAQQTAKKGEGAAGPLPMLLAVLPGAIAEKMNDNPEQALSLIRAAHTAPPVSVSPAAVAAIRAMSRHYQNGTLGFVKDSVLARYWLTYAAVEEDPGSMALSSVEAFADNNLAESWAWARSAGQAKTASPQTKSLAQYMLQQMEAIGGEDIRKEGIFYAHVFLDKRQKRFHWRLAREGK